MTAHRYRALLAFFFLSPTAAFAHSGADSAGFVQGLAHPFAGIDHLLAMMAVGLLASRFDGRQRWLLPLSFLSAMMLGGVLATTHLPLPFVEGFIALSLVAFGVTIVFARAPRFAFAAAMLGAFAVFHGHAHGTEMGPASPVAYSLGFLLATALLHGTGIYLASFIHSFGVRAQSAMRFTGSTVAIAGLTLLGAVAV